MRYISNSPAETIKLAAKVAKKLKPGDVIGLVGNLGSGKTIFTKGLAQGLKVKNPDHVNSPSFVIVKSYPGKLTLHHFDVYRLNNPIELTDIGFDEYLADNGVCVIEWADKVEELLPSETIWVELRAKGENTREIAIENIGH